MFHLRDSLQQYANLSPPTGPWLLVKGLKKGMTDRYPEYVFDEEGLNFPFPVFLTTWHLTFSVSILVHLLCPLT